MSGPAADLAQIARRVEPAARVVPPRALRRAIRLARDADGRDAIVVHDRGCWARRDFLFSVLTPGELGLSPDEPETDLALLPAPETLDLRAAWRTLFHLALDREIGRAIRTDPAVVQEFRDRVGPAQWHEIRTVLFDEHLIAQSDPDAVAFQEFVAFGHELVQFEPEHLAVYFPGLRDPEATLRNVGVSLDVAAMVERARPEGVTEPSRTLHSIQLPEPAPPGPGASEADRQRAAEWSRHGNDLRAAIELTQRGDPSAQQYADRLADRFAAILGANAADSRREVMSLMGPAAAGGWPSERRLLYELQRACLAVERESYAADLVEWLRTFGRRPAVRKLTKPKWLDVTRHLRRAAHFADRRDGISHNHDPLHDRLVAAIRVAEHNARAELRPELLAVLDDVGLVPTNLPERLSREKLVEELLDGACARGFLRIGDLRDAIARNRVKLPDLAGPGELIRGDALLRANEQLTVRLDGVYRRGEIYMRLLQRGCSIFFGTRPGRALSLYLLLPVIGAFVLIEGVVHMIEAVEGLVHWLTGWSATLKGFSALAGGAAGTLAANPSLERGGVNPYLLGVVSVLLLLLIHWPRFRRSLFYSIKFVLVKVPRAVARSPFVRKLLNNTATRFIRRHVALPVGLGAVGALIVWLWTRDGMSAGLVGGGLAILAATLFRTPFGRGLEDRLNETAERAWKVVSVNFLLGLLSLILAFFRSILEAIDRAIYAVDEWLRFREGESKGTLGIKLAVGLVWFVVAYVFRFAWNLLVEPQINPIKHFPVVTVSHKLLLPLIPSLSKQFNTSPETVGLVVWGIPGIFGFLAWELKENWRLYKANASRTIDPVPIGSHGEKMRSLLRPGFHSGVIPKTFAKWRRALRSGNANRAAKARHGIDHAAEALCHLVERELSAYLQVSKRWGGLAFHILHPRLATNRVRLPLTSPEMTGEVIISFEERGGWVIGSVEEPAWLADLTPERRAAFEDALLGLNKLAGTHAVREQAARVLGPQAERFDAKPEGLLVPEDGALVFYDYDDGPDLIAPRRRLASADMVLSDRPLKWEHWVERWEADQEGKGPVEPLLPGWTLLPSANRTS